ncbi:MAG: glycoside hydrolase family protein [Pseudomonadota bacterium]
MVKVPEYQPSVDLRPEFRQDVDVRATPESFGADLGRGLQELGKGMDTASDALVRVQHLEDVTRAKDADNKYADWVRNRQFGEGGFMTLEGRAAVDGRADFEREAAEKRREYGQGLTPGAARAYDAASNARLQSTLQQSIVHTAQARKQWVGDASAARLQTFADDALVNYQNPAMVTKNIAAGQAELRQNAALHGWDAETLKGKERDYVSGVHKNITLQMAQTDPIAAEKYMADKKDFISGADRYALEHSLKVPLKEAQSQRAASDFISGRQSGVGGSAFDMIRRFEGFKTAPYWDVNHFRVGFGSDTITREDGSVVEVKPGMNVTEADAARDLQRRIVATQGRIAGTVGQDKWDGLSAPAKAAVTSVAYNYGTLPQSVADAIRTGGPGEIAASIRLLQDHNEGVNKKRRNAEADAVLGIDMTAAGRDTQSFFTDMESYLSGIKDPQVQELTRRRINAMLETQHKAQQATQQQAKAQLWSYIDQDATPDQIPMEVRQAAGMEAVSSAWSYMETVRKGRDIESDPEMLYGMRRAAAQDPEFFSKVDLNDYRDKLSRADIKELTGLQTSALADQRKAREEGLALTSAFSQAEQQLAAVGISTAGKKGSQLDEANKRIASFNNALSAQMDEFKRANADKKPTQADIQSMINRLLLPVVIKTPGTFFGTSTWAPPGVAGTISNGKTFAFDAAGRPDNSTVEAQVQYSDIPIDLRRGISIDLERELGRKPSQVEVTKRYEDFVLRR